MDWIPVAWVLKLVLPAPLNTGMHVGFRMWRSQIMSEMVLVGSTRWRYPCMVSVGSKKNQSDLVYPDLVNPDDS